MEAQDQTHGRNAGFRNGVVDRLLGLLGETLAMDGSSLQEKAPRADCRLLCVLSFLKQLGFITSEVS